MIQCAIMRGRRTKKSVFCHILTCVYRMGNHCINFMPETCWRTTHPLGLSNFMPIFVGEKRKKEEKEAFNFCFQWISLTSPSGAK
jgi:hypothetical protein